MEIRTLLYPGIINRTKPARVLQATTEPVLSLKMYEHWSYFGGRYFGRQMSHAKFLSDRQIIHTTKVRPKLRDVMWSTNVMIEGMASDACKNAIREALMGGIDKHISSLQGWILLFEKGGGQTSNKTVIQRDFFLPFQCTLYNSGFIFFFLQKYN